MLINPIPAYVLTKLCTASSEGLQVSRCSSEILWAVHNFFFFFLARHQDNPRSSRAFIFISRDN